MYPNDHRRNNCHASYQGGKRKYLAESKYKAQNNEVHMSNELFFTTSFIASERLIPPFW